MKWIHWRFFILLLLFALLCAPRSGYTAVRVWDAGGTNGFWTTAANWVGDVAPVAGDDLEFPPGASEVSTTNNFLAGTLFNSIRISGVDYELEGARIMLNAGINATNTAFANFCYVPLTLNSNQSITSGNSTVNLYLYGDIDTNGKDLTFAGNGGAQVDSAISGSGGLIKTGSGTAAFYTSNTFSGPVQILQGSIGVYHGDALGATNGGTTVTNGTILSLVGELTVREPLVLYGTLNAATQPKVLTGPIVLAASNATIQLVSGSPMTINSVISGSGGFTKALPDVLTLNSNNTYAGTTTVSAGTLRVNGWQPGSPIAFVGGTIGGTGVVGTITASSAASKTIAPGGSPGILTCSNVSLSVWVNFQVELNATTAGSGHDQLNVNGSVALGGALLSVTPGFTPAYGDSFVIINNDGADAVTGTFNNLPQNALITNAATVLRVSYTGGDGNDVTLTTISGTPPPTFTSIVSLTNGFQLLTGLGQSNLAYTIQAASNLNPVIQWSDIGASTANVSGVFMFTDTNATLFPMRFYRGFSP